MAIMQIAVTKAKGTIEVDTDTIPEDVYAEALMQGLKVLLNRGASKVTKAAIPDAEALKAKAMEIAQEQLALVMSGDIKFTGVAKKAKVSGAVMTEARRLARNVVKDVLKKAGEKISHYDAKEITKAANELLAQDDSLIAQAEANLAERAKVPVKIDVKALIRVNPTKVAAAEAKAKKAKDQLSAKQAGMVKTQAKPKGETRAQH